MQSAKPTLELFQSVDIMAAVLITPLMAPERQGDPAKLPSLWGKLHRIQESERLTHTNANGPNFSSLPNQTVSSVFVLTAIAGGRERPDNLAPTWSLRHKDYRLPHLWFPTFDHK